MLGGYVPLVLCITLGVVSSEENVTATSATQRSNDEPGSNYKKATWTTRSSGKTSWNFPALATDLTNVRVISADSSKKPSRQDSGNAFEKKSSTDQNVLKFTTHTQDNPDYNYHDITSSLSDIANFENSRSRDYAKYFAQRVVHPMSTAAANGPRILDIVMHNDPYRNPRKGLQDNDKLFAQESNHKNTFYYEPAPNIKKNDKYDQRGSALLADRNRRYDFDYDSRELDHRSDRRDDHWDEWEDYHYDKYHHEKHHKKDYDYILPLLLLILAPLAVSSFLMPVTATLMSNSMYYAGAQGAVFQGRRKRSLDGRAENRDLLLDLITLLEEAIERFEKTAKKGRRMEKTP